MSAQKKRKPRPKIDEVANKLLSDEKLNLLNNFIEFLNENKLKPSGQSNNVWSVNYKGRKICNIGVWEDYWHICDICHCRKFNFFEKAEKYITSEELKQYISNNLVLPSGLRDGNCGMCMGSVNILVFGNVFEAICTCCPIALRNPEVTLLKYAEELVLISKLVIDDIASEDKIV